MTTLELEPDTEPLVDLGREAPKETDPAPTFEELQAAKQAEREDSALWRLRLHAYPWAGAAGTLAAGAVGWGLAAGADLGATAVAGLMVSTAGAGVAAAVQKRASSAGRPVWCPKRFNVATGVAAAWVFLATLTGPSFTSASVLIGLTIMLSLGYWRAIRIPDRASESDVTSELESELNPSPELDSEPPTALELAQRDADLYRERWYTRISGKHGHLRVDTTLEDEEITEDFVRWTLRLPQDGGTPIGEVADLHEKIAGALGVPINRVQIEGHPSRLTTYGVVTVTLREALREPVLVAGPQFCHDGHDIDLTIGTYGDNTGRVAIPLQRRNDTKDISITGEKGSGKSALTELIAMSTMATGVFITIYLDGEANKSSALLRENATWAPSGSGRVEVVLSAIERLFHERGLYMEYHGLTAINPSVEVPGVMLIVDECHKVFPEYLDRWKNIVRASRAYAAMVMAVTQDTRGNAYGDSELRDLLYGGSTIVLRGLGSDKGRSSTLSTLDLPDEPGWGLLDGQSVDREAPFRTDHLHEDMARSLFEALPKVELDRLSANALGDFFLHRHQMEKERRELVAARIKATQDGAPLNDPRFAELNDETVDQQDDEDPSTGLDGAMAAFQSLAAEESEFDTNTGAVHTADDAVYHAVASGLSKRRDIAHQTGYGSSQIGRSLTALITEGRIVQRSFGVYELPNHDDADASELS